MIVPITGTRERYANMRFRLLTVFSNIFKRQVTDYRSVPVIINNYNRVDCLVELITWLEQAGICRIYIIDNHSTYPPLLDYYESCPYTIFRLDRNVGFQALWHTPIFNRFKGDYYVYTDPDIIPTTNCPKNAVSYFRELLDRFPEVDKVGFGLKIDDLPDHYPLKEKVLQWEAAFWQKQVAPGVYDAAIDTTFALYRPHAQGGSELRSLRTGMPYLARHTSWYLDPFHLSEEETYYQAHAGRAASWTANLMGKKTNLEY